MLSLKNLRGLLYRKIKKEMERKEIELPGFEVKRPAKPIELPKTKDVKKIDVVYPVLEPFAYINIKWDDRSKMLMYNVVEPKLTKEETEMLKRISSALMELIEVGLQEIKEISKAVEYLRGQVNQVIKHLGLKPDPSQYAKIMYYIYRNFIGYNQINTMMEDPNIEDISCDGVGIPIYVVHRRYGSLKTNVVFKDGTELRNFIVKLAERAGRYVSYAEPILDATLPDGSRVAATLASDVATRGATFTIRKFTERPISPVEQIDLKTASPEMLAYFWFLVEHAASMLIVGGVATGKCILPGDLVQLANGEIVEAKSIYQRALTANPHPSVELLTLTPELKIKPIRINKFWRMEAPKWVYQVETEAGCQITTTPEHEFLCMRNGKIVRVRTDQLVKGDYLLTPRRLKLKVRSQPISLDWGADLYVQNKNLVKKLIASAKSSTLTTLASKLGVSYAKLKGWTEGNAIPLRYLKRLSEFVGVDWNSVEEKIEKLESKASSDSFKLIRKTSPQLCRLVGYLIGNGKVYDWGTLFFSPSKALREDFCRLARSFGLKPRVEFPRNKVPRVVIQNKVFGEFLVSKLRLPKDWKTEADVPEPIARCSDEEVSNFIRGLLDCEGRVSKKGCKLELSTSSKHLAIKLPWLLRRFGIVARVRKVEVKGNLFYRAEINGGKDLRAFLEKVGTSDPIREQRIKKLATQSTHNVDVVPIGTVIHTFLRKRGLSIRKAAETVGIKYESFYNIVCGKTNPTHRLLKKLKRLGVFGDSPEIQFIKLLASAQIFWDRVKKVERVRPKSKWVYDFTVDGTHNFVAGSAGGMVISNTTFLNSICMFIPPEAKIVSIEDSVSKDSELIWWRDGKFYKGKISKLVDPLASGKEKIENRWNLKVFSLKDGKVKLCKPSHFIRHKVKKEMVEVELVSGRKIKVTADHSLFHLTESGVEPVECGKLRPNDFIATARVLPLNGKGVKIDLLKKLPNLEKYLVEGEKVKEVIEKNWKKLKKFYSPHRLSYCMENGFLRADLFKQFSDDRERLYLRTTHGDKIPVRLTLDKEFAEIVGLWLAVGRYGRRSVLFSVRGEEAERVSSFTKKFDIAKRSNGLSISLNSTLFKDVLKYGLELSGNARSKRLPNWVFNLRKEELAALLRGYFSASWVKRDEIVVRSTSLKLLKDVQTALLSLGIVLRISTKRSKDKLFEASIPGSFLERFRKVVGFIFSKARAEKLRKVCEVSLRNSQEIFDVIPLPKNLYLKLREELKDIQSTRLTKNSLGGWVKRSAHSLGRRYLQSLLEPVPNLGKKNPLNLVYNLTRADVFWDRIKRVKKKWEEGWVYDISVPEAENFICENVIAHNTRELRLTHEHWIPGLARTGFGIPLPTGEKYGSVSLFDLLKEAFRQNPDYVIVGEVRGEETYVLFQGMASGHPSLSTFHAGSVDGVIKRLTLPPINLPPSLLESLDVITIMTHAKEKGKSARRVKEIVEILGAKEGGGINTNPVFRWNPEKDDFEKVNESEKIKRVATTIGITYETALAEVKRREKFLRWLKEQNIRDYLEVAKLINEYYKNPEKFKEKIGEVKIERVERGTRAEKIEKEFPKKRASILELLGFKLIKEKP